MENTVSNQEHNPDVVSSIDEDNEIVGELTDRQSETAHAENGENESADEGSSPEAQIESLQEELAKTKDDALRMVAEAQNIKRRAEKDVENARKFALEKFSGELLVVADNMERALEAADFGNEDLKSLIEGVELTQKSLIDTLAKFNVEQINPLGEPFDPQYHQAISMVENPDAEPNSVTLVMQKGYTLNGRLLRPAMVMVAKAPTNPVS
jgi:molecular chaperone GrpE